MIYMVNLRLSKRVLNSIMQDYNVARKRKGLMTAIQLCWLILGASWAIIEIALALKTRVMLDGLSLLEYRSERLIWLVVSIALSLALWLKNQHWVALPINLIDRQLIAVILFISGLGLRFYAVFSLGQFFSTSVTVNATHQLIVYGPYKFVRHPAYTGLFVSFLAAGFAMGDVLALLALICPVAYVLSQRIKLEEQWLGSHYGKSYADYSLRTKKLLPWIY